MSDRPDNPEAERVTEEAASWLLRLQAKDCTEEEREQFKLWLSADPAHAAEYEALQEVWTISGELTPSVEPNAESSDTSATVGIRTTGGSST